jgi:hypothetical protein
VSREPKLRSQEKARPTWPGFWFSKPVLAQAAAGMNFATMPSIGLKLCLARSV